jgi:DNA-binding MarR family transcriptional regulator
MTEAAAREVAHRHPDVADIRELLSFRLWRLTNINDRIAQRLLRERFGISLPEWRILGVTAAREPVRVGALLAELAMDKGQASRLMKALSGRGLIESVPDRHDQRRLVLSLTPAGRQLHDRVLAFARERNDVVLSHLSPETAAHLMAALEALSPALESYLAGPEDGA